MEQVDDLEVDRSNITFDRELGQGEFGVVKHALLVGLKGLEGVQSVAVKVMRNQVRWMLDIMLHHIIYFITSRHRILILHREA